jgi:signal transduction histidine kinase
MIQQVLERAGVSVTVCPTVERLCRQLGDETGAALLSDEALTPANVHVLVEVLRTQPPWSDIPIFITTSSGDVTQASQKRLQILEPLGTVSLLERPLRIATLVSAVRAGLGARRRQYQLREHIAERERLLRELKRSNEELAQFAHVASHDLQAPLRMVKSFSELLARRYHGQLDAAAGEFISHIQDGAETMEKLIATLLHYATVGQQPMVPQRVEMTEVVEAVLKTLKPAIEELNAEVSYRELPNVSGDRVLLEQLIQNLVSNAFKYRSGKELPQVRIAASEQGGQWLLSVSDNGPGIAPEYHDRVFTPLMRLHGREIQGTGMGLAVCKRIVERHGGRIWVESEPGQGAIFYFTLFGDSSSSALQSAATNQFRVPSEEREGCC